MTPLHLAALNGNENILEIIGKSNLNSRDYRARKPDQLLGQFIPTLKTETICKDYGKAGFQIDALRPASDWLIF